MRISLSQILLLLILIAVPALAANYTTLVAPYDTAAAGECNVEVKEDTTRWFFQHGYSYRIRQYGQVGRVRFYVGDTTGISRFTFDVWRETGDQTDEYSLVDSSAIVAASLTPFSYNDLTLTDPIRNVRDGDYMGFHVTSSSTDTFLYAVYVPKTPHDVYTDSSYIFIIDTLNALETAVEWAAYDTLDLGYSALVPTEYYMVPPDVVIFGASYLDGCCLHHSYLVTGFQDTPIATWGDGYDPKQNPGAMLQAMTGFTYQNMSISNNQRLREGWNPAMDRYQKDVLDLSPKIVVTMIGTNDIFESSSLTTAEYADDMVELFSAFEASEYIEQFFAFTPPPFDEVYGYGTENNMLKRDSFCVVLDSLRDSGVFTKMHMVWTDSLIGQYRSGGPDGNRWDPINTTVGPDSNHAAPSTQALLMYQVVDNLDVSYLDDGGCAPGSYAVTLTGQNYTYDGTASYFVATTYDTANAGIITSGSNIGCYCSGGCGQRQHAMDVLTRFISPQATIDSASFSVYAGASVTLYAYKLLRPWAEGLKIGSGDDSTGIGSIWRGSGPSTTGFIIDGADSKWAVKACSSGVDVNGTAIDTATVGGAGLLVFNNDGIKQAVEEMTAYPPTCYGILFSAGLNDERKSGASCASTASVAITHSEQTGGTNIPVWYIEYTDVGALWPPADLTFDSTAACDSVLLSWTENINSDSTTILLDGDSITTIAAGIDSLLWEIDGDPHEWSLISWYGANPSDTSAAESYTLDQSVVQVTGLFVTESVDQIYLSWDQVPGNNGYLILLDGFPTWSTSPNTNYRTIDLDNHDPHAFTVAAYNLCAEAGPASTLIRAAAAKRGMSRAYTGISPFNRARPYNSNGPY